MMRTIIIDDEPHCIGALRILLEDVTPGVEIAATCHSGSDGIEAIEQEDPDLIFLDIAMPKMNGFEMLSRLDSHSFQIIFTTAYDSYALQALKVSAVDYLLKPVDFDELQIAVSKAADRIASVRASVQSPLNTPEQHWTMVMENFQGEANLFPNIALPTSNGLEMVRANEILFVEADGNYSRIHIQQERSVFIAKTLKEMQQMLEPYGFVRVHHSHLVNRMHIARYIRGEGGQVVLENGQAINVSRRRKPDLMRALKNSG